MTGERSPDVLGSLPRTRPHRRSQKRPARPGDASAAAPRIARATKPPAPPTSRVSPRPSSPRSKPARLRQPAQPAGAPPGPRTRKPVPTTGSDLLGTAVQAAAELAEIGLSLGARAIRGALARLPRP